MIAVASAYFRSAGRRLPDLFARGVVPGVGIALFLLVWHITALNIDTSLGKFPGPAQVWQQSNTLYEEHVEQREKAERFYQRLEKRNAEKLVKNPDANIKRRSYTGKPTFLDQIFTSLYTVLFGFLLASVVAIPLGIACGLNERIYQARGDTGLNI